MPKKIAVDFDATLRLYKVLQVSEPNELLIKKLIEARQRGHKIILWTCREGEKLQEAIVWCREHGLEFDAVNENITDPQETEADHKVRADVYVDNAGMTPQEFILHFDL